MGVVVITGIPGVGKTTVIERAAKAKNIQIVNYGTVMFEMASAEGLVSHRDEMRKLTLEQQKSLQRAAAEKINTMGNVIVDTHATIKTPNGYLPGLPEWVVTTLKPTTIVLVEADNREIARRRSRDRSRARDPDALESIAEHQAINRAAAMACAVLTGATVKIVQNHDNGIDAAVGDLVSAL